MNQVVINADIWKKGDGPAPTYRVYVDDHLLTERDFVWPSDRTYIKEWIEVFLEPGWHELKIENCTPANGELIVRNVKVNDAMADFKFKVQ